MLCAGHAGRLSTAHRAVHTPTQVAAAPMSKSELLGWVNSVLGLRISRLEQVGAGSALDTTEGRTALVPL